MTQLKPTGASQAGIELYWLPLGAGGWFVRLNGRIWEAVHALLERRRPLDLYHTALQVRLPEGRFVIENCWPIPDADPASRGVVVQGPVASRRLGRLRVFRYEVRRWPDGVIADAEEAVASPQLLSDDPVLAGRLLDLVGCLPSPVWGRDELETGEMWNSNSVISWLLDRSGLPTSTIAPPAGGRAPGWQAGLLAARRHQRSAEPAGHGSQGRHRADGRARIAAARCATSSSAETKALRRPIGWLWTRSGWHGCRRRVPSHSDDRRPTERGVGHTRSAVAHRQVGWRVDRHRLLTVNLEGRCCVASPPWVRVRPGPPDDGHQHAPVRVRRQGPLVPTSTGPPAMAPPARGGRLDRPPLHGLQPGPLRRGSLDPATRGGRPGRMALGRHGLEGAMLEAFRLLTADGPLAAAVLEIEPRVVVRLRCPCGFTGPLGVADVAGHLTVCPSCGAISGRDRTADLELLEVRAAP